MTGVDGDTTLDQAVAALKAGNKAEARRLLEGALAADRHSERAWFRMSGVVDTDSERIACLERVVALNPRSRRARKRLEQLGRTPPPLPGAPLPPPETPSRAPYVAGTRTLYVASADYRLYIAVVTVLSVMLISMVAAILFAAFLLRSP